MYMYMYVCIYITLALLDAGVWVPLSSSARIRPRRGDTTPSSIMDEGGVRPPVCGGALLQDRGAAGRHNRGPPTQPTPPRYAGSLRSCRPCRATACLAGAPRRGRPARARRGSRILTPGAEPCASPPGRGKKAGARRVHLRLASVGGIRTCDRSTGSMGRSRASAAGRRATSAEPTARSTSVRSECEGAGALLAIAGELLWWRLLSERAWSRAARNLSFAACPSVSSRPSACPVGVVDEVRRRVSTVYSEFWVDAAACA